MTDEAHVATVSVIAVCHWPIGESEFQGGVAATVQELRRPRGR